VKNDRQPRRVRLYRWASNTMPPAAWFRLYPMYQSVVRRRRFDRFTAHRVASRIWRLDFEDGLSLHMVSPQRIARYLDNGGAAGVLNAMRDKYVDPKWDLSGDKVVLDVGANIGEFSLALLRENSTRRIYCFEPDPVVVPALELNLRQARNAQVIQVALGEEERETTLFMSSADADSSLIRPERIQQEIKVQQRRLDVLCSQQDIYRIALLKIDAEGFEPEVLRGAQTILRSVDHVAVDAGPERLGASTWREVTEILIAAGFSCRPNPLQPSVVLADRSHQ
jgi:FkbM family methyltransferase